ncbi:MAG: hypothetical protein H6745_13575 [Deltaproteobacteria bacterium]|nr:hypothetical protein [Deltaproteobacteria bacterium]
MSTRWRRLSPALGALALTVALATGCGDDGGSGGGADTLDTSLADTAVADTAVADTAVADTAVADTAVADTEVADTRDVFVADTTPPTEAECSPTAQPETLAGKSWTLRAFDPRCADPTITNCTLDGVCLKEQKDNLVVVPDAITRPELWIHLGGSGGKPTNAKNILRAAAYSGYRALGLAYMNEPSVADRCNDPVTGVDYDVTCSEKTRLEVITGEDVSPWLEIGASDGLISRLEHALAWLDDRDPSGGWDAYRDGEGHVRWDRIAMSGFSQGGGNVGLISRDHPLRRAFFLSKGAGSVKTLAGDCASDGSCADDGALCCDLSGDPECDEPPASGGKCVHFELAPWVHTGAGGEGTAADRATPAARLYGLVNVNETAWTYSPDVFAAWGMDAWGDFISADPGGEGPPFSGTHQLSSALEPCNGGSFHQSMGADAIQPKIGGCDGQKPAMWDAWLYMMSHEEAE